MIPSNRNLYRVFPTKVSPALRYPNKVVKYSKYSAGLRTICDQINLSIIERHMTPFWKKERRGYNIKMNKIYFLAAPTLYP